MQKPVFAVIHVNNNGRTKHWKPAVLRTTCWACCWLCQYVPADSPQFELPVQLSVGLKAFATYLDEPLFTLDDGNVQAIRSKKAGGIADSYPVCAL